MLDRLNALLEPGGVLTMSERGVIDGTIPTIAPHPNFRCFVFLRFFAFFFFLLPNSRFRKKWQQWASILVFWMLFYLPCTVVMLSVWQGRKLHCDEHMIELKRLGFISLLQHRLLPWKIHSSIPLPWLFISNLEFQYFPVSLQWRCEYVCWRWWSIQICW